MELFNFLKQYKEVKNDIVEVTSDKPIDTKTFDKMIYEGLKTEFERYFKESVELVIYNNPINNKLYALVKTLGDKRTYDIFIVEHRVKDSQEHYQFKIMEVQL